jgi:hypothetical protein
MIAIKKGLQNSSRIPRVPIYGQIFVRSIVSVQRCIDSIRKLKVISGKEIAKDIYKGNVYLCSKKVVAGASLLKLLSEASLFFVNFKTEKNHSIVYHFVK